MRVLFILTVLLIGCEFQTEEQYLLSNTDEITNYINGRKGYWSIIPAFSPDVLLFNSEEVENTVAWKSDVDSVAFILKEGDTVDFKIILNEVDTALTRIIAAPRKKINSYPLKAVFHLEDVERFWECYEKSGKDTSLLAPNLKTCYLEQASEGMKDYFHLKVRNGEKQLASHLVSNSSFYDYVLENPLDVSAHVSEIQDAYLKMKEIYPKSLFPDVFFVIGAFTSGGTVSANGLLIGLNQYYQTDDSPLESFSSQQRRMLNRFEELPYVIAHELIHFQQNKRTFPTTVLEASIQEGMADFVCELISGRTANDGLHVWAIGKERMIWEKFSKDMDSKKIGEWIANSHAATPDNPADQGYWVGYQICKSYYENSSDKHVAIEVMLNMNVRDYPKILARSRWQDSVSMN